MAIDIETMNLNNFEISSSNCFVAYIGRKYSKDLGDVAKTIENISATLLSNPLMIVLEHDGSEDLPPSEFITNQMIMVGQYMMIERYLKFTFRCQPERPSKVWWL